MDEMALELAKQRLADCAARRADPADLEAALERSREQIEALTATAAELQASIPAEIAAAVRDAIRTEVLPVGRHIAEIRGLLNQAIRRLERLEGELLSERHARVDDLALIVELVSSGWRGVDMRLAALQRVGDDAGARSGDEAEEARIVLPAQARPVGAGSVGAGSVGAGPAGAGQADALAARAEAA